MKISEKNADFFEKVFMVVKLIPEGRVTSYGAIAKYLGEARSARMVGWAMNISHVQEDPIPAHRVVNRIGYLSGKHHFETPNQMERLLANEGVRVENDQILSFEDHFWNPSKELEI